MAVQPRAAFGIGQPLGCRRKGFRQTVRLRAQFELGHVEIDPAGLGGNVVLYDRIQLERAEALLRIDVGAHGVALHPTLGRGRQRGRERRRRVMANVAGLDREGHGPVLAVRGGVDVANGEL